jgi:hypothetical protein
MNKFHVNPATGEVGPCTASKKDCPHGGSDVHASSPEQARVKYERKMSARLISTLSKSGKKNKGFSTDANPEWAASQRDIGRSSATQPQDSRPNRQRTRKDAKKSAIREQY